MATQHHKLPMHRILLLPSLPPRRQPYFHLRHGSLNDIHTNHRLHHISHVYQ